MTQSPKEDPSRTANTKTSPSKVSRVVIYKTFVAWYISIILCFGIWGKTHAEFSWEIVALKSYMPESNRPDILVKPILFALENTWIVEFVHLGHFSDTQPPLANSLDKRFNEFIRHDTGLLTEDNYNAFFTNTIQTQARIFEFTHQHASKLKTEYNIYNIRELTPKKIIILSQYITQHIVEYGKDFIRLNTDIDNGNNFARIQLGLLNFGNGLIWVDSMLEKVLYTNKETLWICHNYAAVFQVIFDSLVSLQNSSYLTNNFSCTTTIAAKNPLIIKWIDSIDQHIWNTCYYRTPEWPLQTVVIDVTHTDGEFQFPANADFTALRFINEVALYAERNPRSNIYRDDWLGTIWVQLEKQKKETQETQEKHKSWYLQENLDLIEALKKGYKNIS